MISYGAGVIRYYKDGLWLNKTTVVLFDLSVEAKGAAS